MMRPIDCSTFEFWSEDRNEARLDPAFRAALEEHRNGCSHCAEFAFRVQHQRRALRSLPARSVPVNLAVNLRVIASKDRARRAIRRDWASRVHWWKQQVHLWASNLWRPMAIPTVGGVAAALVLFSALMPTFVVQANATADVPTAWYQSAEVYNMSPFGVSNSEQQITLDVRVDSNGKVIDYTVPEGETGVWLKDTQIRRTVENNLLFMTFRPASFFGQPAAGTIRITIRSSRIEVRG